MSAAKPETRVKKERQRLAKILDGMDQNKLDLAGSLIDRAAFITISLQDLEAEIQNTGWTEKYQNGDKQSGVKPSAAANAQIALTKNLTAIIKTLLEIVPPAQKKSKLDEMRRMLDG